jgi:TetR/AcrR family transcriptional repressor of mexJK operon
MKRSTFVSGDQAFSEDAEPEVVARTRGRPRNPQVRIRILEAARTQFAENGLEGASMEKIAECARTSKVTVYTYFSSKEALFNAIFNEERTEFFALDIDSLAVDTPRQTLLLIAQRYTALISDSGVIDHMRVIASTVTKNPLLGKVFYETGPLMVAQAVARYLKRLEGGGVFVFQDVDDAAEQFLGLLKGSEYMRSILGVQGMPAERRNNYLESCVDLFLRGYSN